MIVCLFFFKELRAEINKWNNVEEMNKININKKNQSRIF